MNALLLIDIQNDFLPGGALAVPNGDAIIPLVNQLSQRFDLVVATQDWHPPQHQSFASAHNGKKIFDTILLHGEDQVLWPDHCVQGTVGAALSAQFDTTKVEAIFRKGTDRHIDSYSAFYDNGHLKSTGLAAYLRGKNVDHVYVAGLAGDYCVYYTAKDALSERFSTTIIEDATRSIDLPQFNQVKTTIAQLGGNVISSTALTM